MHLKAIAPVSHGGCQTLRCGYTVGLKIECQSSNHSSSLQYPHLCAVFHTEYQVYDVRYPHLYIYGLYSETGVAFQSYSFCRTKPAYSILRQQAGKLKTTFLNDGFLLKVSTHCSCSWCISCSLASTRKDFVYVTICLLFSGTSFSYWWYIFQMMYLHVLIIIISHIFGSQRIFLYF